MTCAEKKFLTAKVSEARHLPLLCRYKSGAPFDGTGATEIEFQITDKNGATLSKKLTLSQMTLVSAFPLRITVHMNPADFALLPQDKLLDATVLLTLPSPPSPRAFEFQGFLIVKK